MASCAFALSIRVITMRRATAIVLIAGREKRLYDSLLNLLRHSEAGDEVELRFAESFEAALEEVARERYAVCLFDEELGAARLPELALAARRQGYELPLILLAGEDATHDIVESLKGGATDLLIKEHLTPAAPARALRCATRASAGARRRRWTPARSATAIWSRTPATSSTRMIWQATSSLSTVQPRRSRAMRAKRCCG